MKRDIAIAVTPVEGGGGEIWAALSEDGAIVELRLARAGQTVMSAKSISGGS